MIEILVLCHIEDKYPDHFFLNRLNNIGYTPIVINETMRYLTTLTSPAANVPDERNSFENGILRRVFNTR